MDIRINRKNLKHKINNLIHLLPSDMDLSKKNCVQVKNPATYRCVLGCSLNGNSTSPSFKDVKPMKKEERKSLILERR
jgi:hypothetical protein